MSIYEALVSQCLSFPQSCLRDHEPRPKVTEGEGDDFLDGSEGPAGRQDWRVGGRGSSRQPDLQAALRTLHKVKIGPLNK